MLSSPQGQNQLSAPSTLIMEKTYKWVVGKLSHVKEFQAAANPAQPDLAMHGIPACVHCNACQGHGDVPAHELLDLFCNGKLVPPSLTIAVCAT